MIETKFSAFISILLQKKLYLKKNKSYSLVHGSNLGIGTPAFGEGLNR